ncbi:hypothetical protein [Alicyclobacillus ferrooxydans]|uniref:DUF559 domain-containing protein n=1 Tax=Alicyclobacillus ferrooxydans TaxID=471514 RepID=A0A0P9CAI7_9BACL|nr:hypothetical protein [Alicyclobacillus ferrooxydans]KPV42406.1 hypothetical protein AN477_17520 [Alicyclobacillus ferrooxydans]
MDDGFDRAYKEFIKFHTAKRAGPALQRIERGLGHAERTFLKEVWWPAYGHFENLHPEYAVKDLKDGFRFIDFAYIEGHSRLALEIEGFGPHWKDISPEEYTDDCRRANSLVLDGWLVLRFTYHDITTSARQCEHIIRQARGDIIARSTAFKDTTPYERDIIRLAIRSTQPITAQDVRSYLNISRDYSFNLLHGLTERKWLLPSRGTRRINSYVLHPSKRNIRF